MGFLDYAIKRAVDRIILLLGLVILLWFVVEALPEIFGVNPAIWYAPVGQLGRSASYYQNIINDITTLYGFNQPLYVQFVRYLYALFSFNLGYDFQHHEYVINEVMQYLPYTIILTLPPFIFQTLLAIVVGAYAALKRNKVIDHIISNYLILQYNIPGFFILAVLWVVFAVYIKIIPISGIQVLHLNNIMSIFKVYWLPWVIQVFIFGFSVRGILMRNTMVDVLDSDFVKYARLSGLKESTVKAIARRNSIIPVVTRTGIDLAFILGGIYFVEYIFGIPGMGYLGIIAATELNIPLLTGSFFFLTLYALIVLYATDLIYPLVDPRIKLR
jgi:ABC-type dipeptide/oligopeptide/nickel transport systems, permease components